MTLRFDVPYDEVGTSKLRIFTESRSTNIYLYIHTDMYFRTMILVLESPAFRTWRVQGPAAGSVDGSPLGRSTPDICSLLLERLRIWKKKLIRSSLFVSAAQRLRSGS